MTVLVALGIPLCLVVLALAVEVGRIAVARARLAAAADRAAFGAAASLAHSLNLVAEGNWKLHKSWRDLDRAFSEDTQMNREAAARRYAQYESERDMALAEIDGALAGMNDRAERQALLIAAKNAPRAEARAEVGGEVVLDVDADPENQQGRARYGAVNGTIFTDPSSVDTGEYQGLKYLVKPRAPDALVGVVATERVRPMLLGKILGEGVEVGAVSLAQAFGGSVEEFALKGTETIEEAEAKRDAEGRDALYRPALVP